MFRKSRATFSIPACSNALKLSDSLSLRWDHLRDKESLQGVNPINDYTRRTNTILFNTTVFNCKNGDFSRRATRISPLRRRPSPQTS